MSVARFVLAVIIVNLCLIALGIAHGARAQSPTWVNVATEVGLDVSDSTWSVNPADFDRDGDTDLLYVPHYPKLKPDIPRPVLYENRSGMFTVHPVPWDSDDRHDCDFADINRNGFLDIVCAVGSSGMSPTEVWQQDSWGRFHERTNRQGGLNDPPIGRGRTLELFRADKGWWTDLYVNRYDGPSGPLGPNQFFTNNHGQFHRTAWGVEAIEGTIHGTKTCNEAVDYNSDGHSDLMVCTAEGFRLYKNIRGNRFAERAQRWGIGGSWYDAELVDLDGGSGWPDLFRIRPGSIEVRTVDVGGVGSSTTWPLSAGWQVATGDPDGDGDLDIYALQSCVADNPRPTSTADVSDLVLTNDGTGHFTTTTLPPAPHGCGQSVEAIDYNSDGRDDFVVLNGRENSRGPMQMWSYR